MHEYVCEIWGHALASVHVCVYVCMYTRENAFAYAFSVHRGGLCVRMQIRRGYTPFYEAKGVQQRHVGPVLDVLPSQTLESQHAT
jgi:hypothetical protein